MPVIAEHADIDTFKILSSARPLKISYDVSPDSVAKNRDCLEKRPDYDQKLAEAFEDLISIATAEAQETKSAVDSMLESGLFLSAKSSFHSELAGAVSTLQSMDVTPADSDEEEKDWGGTGEVFYSPTSPGSRHFLSPPTSPIREHFLHHAPVTLNSPLRRQISR